MKILSVLLLAICISVNGYGQTNSISGTVNAYTGLLSFDPCSNAATVVDGTAFSIGDYVLLMQMKGAALNTSNTPSFGGVDNYNSAGWYEFNYIAGINGNTVTFKYNLSFPYDLPAGVVQLIKVPVYTAAQVNATLTCAKWNGTTGGVLAIKVTNELTLNADIIASTTGFRGGKLCSNPDGGCTTGNTNYSYAITSGLGAEKGEGISVTAFAMDGGRGAWANGGGGGNKHNSGGGGGGNFTAGGRGGNEANFCAGLPIGGEGGKSLDYTTGRLFLGGGGGCSDNNNAVGTTGTDGGGIIIIEAGKITGNGFSIVSDAADVSIFNNSIGDGAGGAGAGGTIFISCPVYAGQLTLQARGGRGGEQNNNYGSCFGTGGGGGSGAVLLSIPAAPPGVNVLTVAGKAGTDLNPASPCYQQSYGATDGLTATGPVFNQNLKKSAIVFAGITNNRMLVQKCVNKDIVLQARNALTFSWVPSSGLSADNIANPVCAADANTTYIVTQFPGPALCPYIDTFDVQVTQGIVPLFAPVPELCLGATAPILSTLSDNTISGNWLPAVINTSAPGTTAYNFTPDTGQCASNTSINVTVVKKVMKLFIPGNLFICPNETVLLKPIGNYVSYLWQDLSVSPALPVSAPGNYSVKVKDNDGCSYSDTIEVKDMPDCNDIFFPNAFSPNDNSNNKFFGPLGNLTEVANYKMQIFNRYGSEVFTSRDPLKKWDGKHQGQNQPAGNYVFIATYQYRSRLKRQVKKNIMLIR